jgi:hypothetical protein
VHPRTSRPFSPADRFHHRHRHRHHLHIGRFHPTRSLLSSTATNWLILSFPSLLIDYQSLDPNLLAHILPHLHHHLAAFPWASSLPRSHERAGKTRKKMSELVKAIPFIRAQMSPPHPTCIVPLVMGQHRLLANLPSYPRSRIRRVHRMAAGNARWLLPRVFPSPSRRTVLPPTSQPRLPTHPTHRHRHHLNLSLSRTSPLLSISPPMLSSHTTVLSSPPAALIGSTVPGGEPLASAGIPMGSKLRSFDVDDFIQRLLDVGYAGKVSKSLCLKNPEIIAICQAAREILLSQPTLIELSPPVKIVGDVHGQYSDLIRLFEMCGFPPASNYLFLGDYVDRGKQSLETFLLLLCYKIKYPENFFLLRGNHECANVTRG